MEYGVQVDNKFVFGSDDEIGDPSDLIKLGTVEKKTQAQKKAEREEAKRAKVKAEAERVKAAAAAAAAKAEKEKAAASTRGAPRGRGGRGRGDGPRPPRFEHRDADGAPVKRDDNGGEFRGRGRGRGRGGDRPFRGRGAGHVPAVDGTPESEEHKDFGDENVPPPFDGERRGRGRGGFGRGGRGGFRGRQFDRQSGSDRTGIRPTEKKEGYGKGNWGTDQDELVGETEEVKVEEAEPVVPREKTAEELEAERIEAEIAKQKTLAEYRASLQKEEIKFNTRKAGEGVEENFGKLVPLQRKEIGDNDAHEVVVLSKEKKKQVVDVDIHFVSSREPRGNDRGGRGGFRGGRGRGGGGHFSRGGNAGGGRPRHDQSHFKRDESDFPALG